MPRGLYGRSAEIRKDMLLPERRAAQGVRDRKVQWGEMTRSVSSMLISGIRGTQKVTTAFYKAGRALFKPVGCLH